MSLSQFPIDSIEALPEGLRKGLSLTRDKFEKTVSWRPEKGCRMALFRDGAITTRIRLIEEEERGAKRPRISAVDAGSLLIRTEKPEDFSRRFGENKVTSIAPNVFRFDFAEVGEEFARFVESPDPIAKFRA